MKRVYISVWWFADAGGMEQHVENLACALSRRNLDVVVFSQMPLVRGNHYVNQLRRSGIRVIGPPGWMYTLFHSHKVRNTIRKTLSLSLRPLRHVQVIGNKLFGCSDSSGDDDWCDRVVYREYSQTLSHLLMSLWHVFRPADILHVHGFRLEQVWALHWGKQRSLATVYTEHGTIGEWGGPWDDGAGLNLKYADVVSCVSAQSRESLREYQLDSRSIEIVTHIIADPGTQEASASRETPNPARPGTTFTMFGRLREEKGGAFLLHALKLVRQKRSDIVVRFAGDGPDRSRLEELTKQLGLSDHVMFLGYFSPLELNALMAETDVVVIPSRTEGQPLTLVDALAHGKPIVATRVGGIPDLITNLKNGLLVEPTDVEALADSILLLANDEPLRKRLGEAARGCFLEGKFTEEAVMQDMLALYERASVLNRASGEGAAESS
ncbi:MAG: glycosyltransferase family 4 protein [Gammaproteobacteria bacterium]